MLLLLNCASTPKPVDTRFEGQWQSCETVSKEQLMCLDETDIGKLLALLMECGDK